MRSFGKSSSDDSAVDDGGLVRGLCIRIASVKSDESVDDGGSCVIGGAVSVGAGGASWGASGRGGIRPLHLITFPLHPELSNLHIAVSFVRTSCVIRIAS